MISMTCPQCRQFLQMPEESAGQKVPCAHCGNLIDVVGLASHSERPPPFPADLPVPVLEPVMSAPSPPREKPQRKPSLAPNLFLESTTELAINSIILGGLGFVGSAGIVSARYAGIFPSILLGIAVLGLGGLGLALGIMGMLRAVAQQMKDFWYVLSGLVLSSLAIVCGLTMLIAALIMKLTVP
jgi:hypothetical protein